MTADDVDLLRGVWASVGGDPDQTGAVSLTGPRTLLPSVFDVTGVAATTVAAAGLAAAATLAARSGGAVPAVAVDRRAAAAAFSSERLFTPHGWSLPPAWDPVAGDYAASDGWIRLHTNYAHHRTAVARVLGGAEDRSTVARRVATWSAVELETTIADAGGCAAVMHDERTWHATQAGAGTAAEPLARVSTPAIGGPTRALAGDRSRDAPRPYGGVRVLDLTRVIAGPVATRFLAAYGADVLRIDPPDFVEVPALLPDVTVGKRCASLDLTTAAGRATFERLLAAADVLVCGLRPSALANLGYDSAGLRAGNPDLVIARLDAYGWDGPWQGRRGFDSLVQMSCGIAAAGAKASEVDRPVPLPVQALDHATGYLLAAAIGAALVRRLTGGGATEVRTSLIGTANLLLRLATPEGLDQSSPQWTEADTEPVETAWGRARRVPVPVQVAGAPAHWRVRAGPLGRHEPHWAP